jgi:ATP-binding cassette subfamily F protein uup
MDSVVTSLLVMGEDGSIEEQAGGYSDWESRGGRLVAEAADGSPTPTSKKIAIIDDAVTESKARPRRKLGYKEQRELDGLPARIEGLEEQQARLELEIASPEFYQQPEDLVRKQLDDLEKLNGDLESAIERWSALEE